jgi:ATP-dependent DNA helicase RecQ
VDITPDGLQALKSRRIIMLTKTASTPSSRRTSRAGDMPCDEALFEKLRQLRKKIADERGVPAYVIFGDATLRQMARDYPETNDAMSHISGVGERKLEEFGEVFLDEIAAFLQDNPKSI